MGSGMVGLHLKSTYKKAHKSRELFTIPRNWLTLGAARGGAVPSESTRPQMSKHQNTENKRHDKYNDQKNMTEVMVYHFQGQV